MIFNLRQLKSHLSEYKNKNDKISRMIKNKEIIGIVRGLYSDDLNENREVIASNILVPSYLSFEYVLSKSQLIPEDAKVYTSATCNKRKKKIFNTEFGIYAYYDIPKEVFTYGVELVDNNKYKYFIATKEKALCDKLYATSPLRTVNNLKEYLFNNLRVDEEEFSKLNRKDLLFLLERYKCTNCKLLLKLINSEV